MPSTIRAFSSRVLSADPAAVFDTATSSEGLDALLYGLLENIRVGPSGWAEGGEFTADESLAEGRRERDHRMRITAWNPSSRFAFHCVQGETLACSLSMQKQSEGTLVTWSVTGGPSGTFDKIMVSIFRGATEKQAQKQAAGQLDRLARMLT